MVFINVFQFFILFLIIHSHLLPVFTLTPQNHIVKFFFPPFLPLHITYTFQKYCRSTTSPLLMFCSSCTFSFLSLKPLSSFFMIFLFSCLSLSPLKGTWMDRVAAVFLTGLIGLIFYLEQGLRLCYTYIDLQLLCKSRHWLQTLKVLYVVLLFQRRLAFTTHTILWLLLSPLFAHVCIKFCHARPQRESNH